MKDLIIQKEGNNERIILTENGKIVEQYEQNEYKKRLEGNIYIGIVEDVLEGMQAAFINIGEGKNAFIHLKEIVPKVSTITGNKNENFCEMKIKNYLKKGQALVVQVKKDCLEKKGARVSTELNIPGKFVVLIPNSKFVTISKKIESQDERERLINIVEKSNIGQNSIIVRTSAEGKSEEEIKKDIQSVLDEYKQIKNKVEKVDKKEPRLLFENSNLIKKIITDIVYLELDRIITNSKEVYNEISEILKKLEFDEKKVSIQLKEGENVLEIYDVESQIEKLNNNKIWLKCGGFITIDKTEALTAIDVNSGKYTGKENLEQTIFKVNSQATIEIAKQLKLRDIGGIIIIDYIDMCNNETRSKIIDIFENELKKDRAKTQIVGFTKLDLLEVTRKHISSN